jgi:putative ABC transport system permease protein
MAIYKRADVTRLQHILRSRLRSVFLRGGREADLREELQLHIERETEQLRASGLSPEAARQQALRSFGGVEQIKEACRDARGTMSIDALRRDVRHSVRRLVRDWRFTTAAILILGLGIGANTAMFSVVNTALFAPRNFANPERLVDIYQNGPDGGVGASSYPAYLDMAAYTDVFSATMAVTPPQGVNYYNEGALRSAITENTTSTYLSVLGLHPSLGRWFDAAEDTRGAPVVGVVGHETWIRKFHSDPSILGRIIRIEGVPVTIVGVGPAGHSGTLNIGVVTDFWLPINAIPAFGGPPNALERRPPEAAFLVKARLRDGASFAQAQAAMTSLGARLKTEYPKEDPGTGISVYASSDVRIHPQIDALLRAIAFLLTVVVGLVLAIACSNLATLLLVRGVARSKEVSVRLALGASRGQLVRHLLIESVLLSGAGGIAGCLLAWWTIRSLGAIDLPIIVELSLDYRVLAFAIGLALVTGVAFGLAPALKTTRIDLLPTLRDDGEMRPGTHRRLTLKNALVMFQVAVSVLLLGGTTIYLQMLDAARTQRVGFAIDGVSMVETDTRYSGYSAAQASNVLEHIRRRVAAIPGVQSAVLTYRLPMRVTGTGVVVDRAGAESTVGAGMIWAGPGFFDVLRIPVLYGRVIDERDRADTPRVAVISETMARQYFGDVNAVGRRFRLDPDTGVSFEVVGVVRDTGTANLTDDLLDPRRQLIYRPFAQAGRSPTTVLARTSFDAATLVATMQRELRGVDVTLPAITAKTMEQYLEDALVAPKAVVTFLGALAALGLSLAGIGLYAVVAFAVSGRARDIGIRMALGARSQQVVWNVARDVAVLVGAGTGVGLTLSLLAIVGLRVMSTPAPGVANISIYRPTVDPVVLAAIALFMSVVGIAAAAMPAWRAATMDPLKALRRD